MGYWNLLRCFEVGRLKLRETGITFDVLSYCRNQDRGYVCGEKVGVGPFVSDQCVADQSAEASRPGNIDGVKSGADIIEAENDEGG